ncbi:MAG TPA: rhodanese-like domain-containing protein [Flavipsychrobacter sp.]|nr:rhodanese-like domain-containing protein [Flavipsychrobacter sp.]
MKRATRSDLQQWEENGISYHLIDVREEWERQAYSIGGVHIPLSELLGRKDEILKNEPVVIYCEKGIRSQLAIQRLESSGYENLYNLEGGMKAWKLSTTT